MSDEMPNGQAADGLDELKKKLEELESQRDEYLAGWQRAKADLINYKKEEGERLRDIARYSNEELVRDLLTILDSFDLAIAYAENKKTVQSQEDDGTGKGIYIIKSQVEDILKRYGLERIESVGEFDPGIAEAIGEVESDKPPGTVVEEVSPGYRLHGKVLRPARVKVAKNKEKDI